MLIFLPFHVMSSLASLLPYGHMHACYLLGSRKRRQCLCANINTEQSVLTIYTESSSPALLIFCCSPAWSLSIGSSCFPFKTFSTSSPPLIISLGKKVQPLTPCNVAATLVASSENDQVSLGCSGRSVKAMMQHLLGIHIHTRAHTHKQETIN